MLPTLSCGRHGLEKADISLQIANGEIAMIWLGAAVSPQILDDLYGVENLEDLDTRMVCPPFLALAIYNIPTDPCENRHVYPNFVPFYQLN